MKSQYPYLRSAVAAAALFVLAVAAAGAHGNAIVYKYTGRDGVTVYSQTLPENYSPRNVETIEIGSMPVEQQRAAVRMLDAMSAQTDADAAARAAKLDQADRDIDAAIKNLQQAEQNLKKGSELVGGDRVANINGGSRIRESYFLRVSQLQAAVELAKQKLDQAYVERNDLR